jgi:hypothetical protein
VTDARADGGARAFGVTAPAWRWLLAAVVLAALVLRLPGLDAGPGYANHDERIYVPKSIRYGGGDLNPHWFDNPPLMSYLMFVGQGVRYAAGRLSGTFASAADFRADFAADASAAFLTGRIVVVLLALIAVVHVAFFARRVALAWGCGDDAARAAGILAAAGLAACALHIERSRNATNDVAVTLAYTLTAHAAFELAREPTLRRALLAGALAGVAAGTKYTGAFASLPVGVACFAAAGLAPRRRVALALAAGAAFFAGFLAVCPWAVLDWREFRDSAYLQVFQARGRHEATAWFYPEVAWRRGFGPAWTVLGVAAATVAAASARAWPAVRARTTVVLVAAALLLPCYLATRRSLAMERHLLPVVPASMVLIAACCCAQAKSAGAWLRRGAVVAAVAALALSAAEMPERFREASTPRNEDAVVAWIRANLPDGAWIVADYDFPWLVRTEDRERLGRSLSPEWAAKMTPAFRLRPSYSHFADPVGTVDDAGTRADDWAAIAKLGPAYVLESSRARDLFRAFEPGDYPGERWHRDVARSLPVIRRFPCEGRTGAEYTLYAIR